MLQGTYRHGAMEGGQDVQGCPATHGAAQETQPVSFTFSTIHKARFTIRLASNPSVAARPAHVDIRQRRRCWRRRRWWWWTHTRLLDLSGYIIVMGEGC
ncbi:hypothetical protein CPLU01_13940 [Colletotrichum plurivorum]|uniref:Uncharacterized protein n=1 Tax=Colletotrichum plurivorum TaxID=2175906 RepID=A0A8H6JNB6_9PEZI|nr:hypothetical protein CPLU01_13940 [Colletotrichum plurivorum]